MEIKLHDAELKVMNVIWRNGTVSAKVIYETLATYTLIKCCIDKQAIKRIEPGFYVRF